MSFVHLHVHSHYSLLDGAVTVKDLVRTAADYGMPALALTDHGNLFGAVQFFRACKAAGLKPIVGMEAYVAPAGRTERRRYAHGAFSHFVLLARDEEGYRNLMKLSSLSYLEGFYYKPRVDRELLGRFSRGLIGMSACLSSDINRTAVEGTERDLRAVVEAYRALFEPGCFFLEIQRNGLPEQERVVERIVPLAKELGITVVATNDVHYLRREDARAQEVHLCINTNHALDDSDRLRFSSDQFYFRSEAEMRRVFSDFPEAVDATCLVADLCRLEIDFTKKHLPLFTVDAGARAPGPPKAEEASAAHPQAARAASDDLLVRTFRELCIRGARERYPDFDANPAAQERLAREMDVIERMGYVSYFLIVWDFIRYARENGIRVGPGRGSAAGSIVAYALRITNVDPLKYDLLFERFLNEDRVTMPDIDIDFCMIGREKVIEYVKRKYGEDRVCQIITFGTMAARAVLRDVGRALGVSLAEVDAIAKRIPAGPKVSLEDSLQADPDLIRLRDEDPRIRELFDVSLRLEGLARHASTHAAGVVISDAPLIETLPLYKDGANLTTQFTMEDLESVGMLKMDFLGLRTLTIIDLCLKLIEKSRGIRIDIDAIPLDDPATYQLLCRGDSIAVFQLESKGMRDLLRRLKPDRFEDVIAALALYRPGPLEGGMVESYVQRKHGLEPMVFEHPILEPILRETNGVILYQEQVMRIANQMAGFSLDEADTLRKAMGKKKREIMETYKEKFIAGAAGKGIDRAIASRVFDLIEFFAGYGFNKSHSTAYALVSYQTAYLKANYPTEFMASVLTWEHFDTDKLFEYIEEARRMGIRILPPDIQRSGKTFTVEGDAIRYGLEAVKGIGTKSVDGIIESREREGPYRSIYDFCARLDPQTINKGAIEALLGAGAFDSFGCRRSQIEAVLDQAIQRGQEERRDRKLGQKTLFDLLDAAPEGADSSAGRSGRSAVDEVYPDIPEWSEADLLQRERKSLGFYLTGHPLLRWKPLVLKYATHTLNEVDEVPEGTWMVIAVQVSKLTKKVSKRTGEPFWIATIEDLKASREVFIGADLYEEAKGSLEENSLVFVRGLVHLRGTSRDLKVESIVPFSEAPARLTRSLSIVIRANGDPAVEDLLFRLKGLILRHRGGCPVYLILEKPSKERVVIETGEDASVAPDLELIQAIEELCGEDTVLVNRNGRRP
ncbi:MAG: DNA polymerase III subunit alpha [Planctomycetota bacterium]